ncbi:hypothetical protein M758_12G123000 [Ceratodon purpureus]|nr:hypothetical protein M758_12G123000 [Ceratodon purpureus]
MEMEIEALATLRLNQSPRRYRGSRQLYEDESTPSSPYYLSAPTSPRLGSMRKVEETPLGEVHAAVPFDWEERPGTPKKGRRSRKDGDIMKDDEEDRASRSPSPERSSRQSSMSEFDFGSARFIAEEDTHAFCNDVPIASADQLFLHGQLLPLRLPPRLQAVKQLRESSEDGSTIHGSFRMPVSPRSGSSPMKQLMSFRGRSKSPQRDGAGWPFHEVESGPKAGAGTKLQKFRSLSPLRIFKRENSEVSILFSEKSTSGSDSTSSSASSARSSAFSSSSSGDENNDIRVSREFWPTFEEKQRNGKTLNEFLYSDKPPTSPKIDVSKLSSKEVLKKAERFKLSEEGLKSMSVEKEKEKSCSERKALTPQLSRSNARSISRTPIILPQAYEPMLRLSKQRDATSYPKRFGILKRCLGYEPPSSPGY